MENPWWKLKKQLYGRRKVAKKYDEFVVSATVGLGLDQCPEQPLFFRRPGTTLIFELTLMTSMRQEAMWSWHDSRKFGSKTQVETCRADGSWVAVQLPPE